MTEPHPAEGMPEIIGPPLLDPPPDEGTRRIGTVFPFDKVVISGPGVHAFQKLNFIGRLNDQRAEAGLPPLTTDQAQQKLENAVDLIIGKGAVFIRPQPEQMPLAFKADELLQKFIPKHRIKFLHINDPAVRRAIELRGECWRFSRPPQTDEEERRMILDSKIAIHGRSIYYYNMKTGTRFLTFDGFARLGKMPPEEFLAHLKEIREHAGRRNRRMFPEIEIFMADKEQFSAKDFHEADFNDAPQRARDAYEGLVAKFRQAVAPDYRKDDLENREWRNAMLEALCDAGEGEGSEEQFLGLSPEYFMKIQWMPGARIEDGVLVFDSIYDQCAVMDDPEIRYICRRGPRVKEFIFNAFRGRSNMESINIGRVEESLARRRSFRGYRGVYIEAINLRGAAQPSVKLFRMQKWDIWQYLDDGADLATAMLRAAEYTNYILNRHLACRQIGMAVLPIVPAKLGETYAGSNEQYKGIRFWSTYFERDYIFGCSTDKVPPTRFADPQYALRFARLLGAAAAVNIVVGRMEFKPQGEDDLTQDGTEGAQAEEGGDRKLQRHVLFDDGDEILQEDANGLPERILASDFTGAFADYTTPLQDFAESYARPVNVRLAFLPDGRQFAEEYRKAFWERFQFIQEKYRRRRQAFDMLFDNEEYDAAGNLRCRWENVLRRLDETDPLALVSAIREHIRVQP